MQSAESWVCDSLATCTYSLLQTSLTIAGVTISQRRDMLKGNGAPLPQDLACLDLDSETIEGCHNRQVAIDFVREATMALKTVDGKLAHSA